MARPRTTAASLQPNRPKRTGPVARLAGSAPWFAGLVLGIVALLASGRVFADDPPAAQAVVERVALLVASNDGPSDRQTLRYAESDAHAVSNVLHSVGGLSSRNEILVYDASPRLLERGLAKAARRVRESAAAGHHVELVFYYSGHSDERGLLLGEHRYNYKKLHDALQAIDADVRIAILDSCASGAFTRIKGGTRRAPSS